MNNKSKMPSEEDRQLVAVLAGKEMGALIKQLMESFEINQVLAAAVCAIFISTVSEQIKVDELTQSNIQQIIDSWKDSIDGTNNQ